MRELRKRDQGARDARVSATKSPLRDSTPLLARSLRLMTTLFVSSIPSLIIVQRKEEARVAKERKELAWQRDHAYDDMMSEENLAASSNQDRDEDFLDDFM